MPTIDISDNTSVHREDSFIRVNFEKPQRVLSSAVLNGGLKDANHIINVRVKNHTETTESPASTLDKFSAEKGLNGTVVGMMTAAPLHSLRFETEYIQGTQLSVLITCGLDNAMCAGDSADHRQISATPTEVGTINTIILTGCGLNLMWRFSP